ncbi:Serine/threonine-protein kinase StkP [Pirellula sp. SH-Sr6A]|uniref:protein kinase domain-containing protein n=1 Tax=Pirellula sp. SH-Sr6A TaxID=1632865 RepID=UPI00078C44EB|nr:protein kinase [Pirellula sp. SH-Sr6A]AMV34815.1 Serine/threonine-protein kinase StkP [Pirellula sp. SH-Sr6A]
MATLIPTAASLSMPLPFLGQLQNPPPLKTADSEDCRFSQWRLLPNSNPPRYFAWDSETKSEVEIRFMPWLQNHPEGEEACRTQCERIHQIRDPLARRVLDFGRSEGIPRMVLAASATKPLKDFLVQADRLRRVELALNLLWTVHTACTHGLFHGDLNAECVHVLSDEPFQIQCDYTERFLRECPTVLATASSLYESDLRAAIALVQTLVLESLETDETDSQPPARHWAVLKRLAREKVEATQLESQFDAWCKTLGDCIPENRNPFYTKWVAPLDRTLSVAVQEHLPRGAKHARIDSDVPEDVQSNFAMEVPELDGSHRDPSEDTDEKTFVSAVDHPADATGSVHRILRPGDLLGNYRLHRLLGQGGMGMVFQATDTLGGKAVAVKVLLNQHGDNPHSVRRFTKEARILASVRNEYVTELLEVGQALGYHFLAMEYVDGPTFKSWLRGKAPLPERDALQFIADLCKALSQAHAQQIIHRDIKPDNILLASRSETASPDSTSLSDWRIKLSDFGIARHIHQSASMEVTRAGTMLGTPMYMAPEQCKGQSEIGPAADVYAIGIMLFEMLTGDVPFRSDDPMKTAAMQCFDPPPDLQKRNRAISDRTCQLVTRMLAKNPSDRFADATQLLLEINRILNGTPSALEDHPRLPTHESKKLWTRTFEWTLQSQARDLWPLVSDTDRLNRAVGLPAVTYRNEQDPERGLRKFGSFHLGAVKVSWEEHPFEWIEGRRMGVLREFSSGPFKWFMSSAELLPLPSGGTKLIHTVKIEPRNTLGTIVSTIEAGWKGGRALDRVYKHIDEFLQSKASSNQVIDPFEDAPNLSRARSKRLDDRAEQMRRLGIDAELCRMLSHFIRYATPQAAAKIRPLALAKTLGVDPDILLDACIVAASVGILQLHWDILCPSCKAPAASEPLLSRIENHTQCDACDSDFQSNLADSIEMVFAVHPELREVDSATYCVGGPGNSPHVISQVRLQPGERIELELPIQTGNYLLRTTQSIESQTISVRSSHAPSQLEFFLSNLGQSSSIPSLREGAVSLFIENNLDKQQLVRLERTIVRDDVVTAASASAITRFRKLFPDQVFQSDVPVTSEDLTLVALQVNNVESLYDRLGDTEAYRTIQNFMQEVEKQAAPHRGAVVKSISEGMLLSFRDCGAAIRFGIHLQNARCHDPQMAPLQVGIAVHRGRLLISNQNGRLDYFGSNARLVMQIASRIQTGISMTEPIFSDPLVQHIVKETELPITLQSREVSPDRKVLLQEWILANAQP